MAIGTLQRELRCNNYERVSTSRSRPGCYQSRECLAPSKHRTYANLIFTARDLLCRNQKVGMSFHFSPEVLFCFVSSKTSVLSKRWHLPVTKPPLHLQALSFSIHTVKFSASRNMFPCPFSYVNHLTVHSTTTPLFPFYHLFSSLLLFQFSIFLLLESYLFRIILVAVQFSLFQPLFIHAISSPPSLVRSIITLILNKLVLAPLTLFASFSPTINLSLPNVFFHDHRHPFCEIPHLSTFFFIRAHPHIVSKWQLKVFEEIEQIDV